MVNPNLKITDIRKTAEIVHGGGVVSFIVKGGRDKAARRWIWYKKG